MMMIKKILMMSSGVVLGSMITATSFAWQPPSNDCQDARAEYGAIMDALKACKNGTTDWRLWCEEITDIRACKNGSLEVLNSVCPLGSYGEEGAYSCDAIAEPVCEDGEEWISIVHWISSDNWQQWGSYKDLGSCETDGEAGFHGFWIDYRCECGIFDARP